MKHESVVLVPSCSRMLGEHSHYVAGKKYVEAVRLGGCLPLVVPSIHIEEIDTLLDLADGVLLTGSPSNVHPRHFGEPVHNAALPLDPERDDWTLPLIRRVLQRGVPLFAICRGFQEVNVALGGSLHQAVHDVPGQHDHRNAKGAQEASSELAYGPSHPITVVPGGTLEAVIGAGDIEVNSVHGQGVNRLAEGLRVEARAPDGLIEAFSMPDAPAFNLCVQWHPEWRAASNPVSMRMLKAFGAAVQAFRSRRVHPGHEPDR